MRDYPSWMSNEARGKVRDAIERSTQDPKPSTVSLCVAVYEPLAGMHQGRPLRDTISFSGIGVIVLQLTLSFIPMIRERDWLPFAISLAGNFLAWLPLVILLWAEEK